MTYQISNIRTKWQEIVANQINESRFKMSKAEQKLILYCIAMIDNKEGGFKRTFEMDIKDFVSFLEIKGNDYYQRILDITADFAGRVFEINLPDGRLRQIPALSMVEYYKGKVTLKVNQELAPFLIEMKSKFTKYSLQEVLMFKSGFSMRIYQLLAQYQYKNEVEYSLEQLRFCLNIPDDKFKLFGDFRRYVLDKAKKEINKKSSLKFEYEIKRKGQKVVSIKFIITQGIKPQINLPGTVEETPKAPSLPQDLKQVLQDAFDFSSDQLDQLAIKHSPEALKNALDVVLYNQKETLTEVKKPQNLFYDCLKNPDKYDLFPIEDKRQKEEKQEEEKRQEEEVLEQEEEEKQTEQERRKLKRQMVQAYIEVNLEDYEDLLAEALQELQEKNSFLYTQVQKLAKKRNITEAEALQISPFTKNLAEEKVWTNKLEGNVEF